MELEQLRAETDIETYRSSGPGGQHKNKRSTAVRLTHRPTGITAISTRHRSLDQNMTDAFETLMTRVLDSQKVAKPRKPTKKTYGAKLRTLAEKSHRGAIKKGRRSSGDD
ncbi:MAG: peptide chain release factor-like protein [Candidatus Sericytochromatia bacterium]|nr:peptide chain release factor-like protein [Candidatus Sericytochromatia bacterium]